MNEKIDKLITWLNPQISRKGLPDSDGQEGERYILPPIGVETSRSFTRKEFREEIKKILGIDKQCFQCLEFHFLHDLSVIEETGELVCQDCAEGIIAGNIKVREQ